MCYILNGYRKNIHLRFVSDFWGNAFSTTWELADGTEKD